MWIKRTLSILAACALALAAAPACTTVDAVTTAATTKVSAEQIATAKDTAYGLESGYALALSVAIAWGKQPTCGRPGAPPAPFCKTLAGMEKAEASRAKVRSAIDRLNSVIADTSTTTSILSVALSGAKAAYAEYQSAVPSPAK